MRVVVTPFDGELAGPPAAAECEVVNTRAHRARSPRSSLRSRPRRAASQVAVRKPSSDADGDAVTYRYAWSRDGVPLSIDGGAVPAAMLRHGEIWRVEVTPFDGEQEGESVVLQASVGNTPPPAPAAVALVARRARGGRGGRLRGARPRARRRPGADRAALPLVPRTTARRRSGRASPTLPAGVVRRGERWRCEAWASDGTAESARRRRRARRAQQPPIGADGRPSSRSVRGAATPSPAASRPPRNDPDDDPVSYAYAWTENDRPVAPGAEPARVDAEPGREGEALAVHRHADGRQRRGARGERGGGGREHARREPAVVRLEPSAPRQGEPFRCEVAVKSEDPDGDSVRYRYHLAAERGSASRSRRSSQEVPPRLVKAGDRWRCTVTPTDGAEDGPSSGTEEAIVAAPPPRRRGRPSRTGRASGRLR